MEVDPPPADSVPPTPNTLSEWIASYRDSLRAMVALRMDPRLRSRVDPSDILQEAFVDAAKRVAEQPGSQLSPRLWLRFLAKQQMLIAYRKHLGTQARDARREMAMNQDLSVSSDALLQAVLQSGSTPSQHVMRDELLAQLQAGLNQLDEIDREVLVMRHFEQLSVSETAAELSISEAAAAKRYYRALKRIAELLSTNELPVDR